MAANVDKIASTLLSGASPPVPSPGTSRPVPSPQPPTPTRDPLEFRLVIEEDPAAPGLFIYKTVDCATGAVVSQLPREQLVKLRENPAYEAGTVFRTSA